VTALGAILRARVLAAAHHVRGLADESLLKIAVVAVVGGGLWAALFAASMRSFRFLSRYPHVREDVIYTTLALLFMALSVLLVFSSAILSLGSLFRTAETAFLLSTPAPAGSVYAYKTLDGLVFSSWAFLIMGLPPMLAYGIDVRAPVWYYLGLPAFFFPFTLLTASVGTLVGLALTGLLPRQRWRLVLWLAIAAAVAGGLVFLRTAIAGRGTLRSGELWREQVLGHLSFLRNRYLPHTWLTRGLLHLAAGKEREAALPWLATCATGVFVYLAGDSVARTVYARVWSRAASSGMKRRFRRGPLARLADAVGRPAGRIPALFVGKDIRLFLRDPAQWSQVAIFFGLLGLYILNLRNLHYDFSRGLWLHLVSTLNLGATSLTLATLTTRFVFPQMSLEGRRFWVLGLAPVRRREILLGKFAFSLGGTLAIAETLVVLSNWMLRMPPDVFLTQAIAAVLVCTGLVGLAVGLGAVFPDYRETSSAKIVSGFGGTLTLVLSVFYVAAIVGVVAVPSHMRLAAGALGRHGYARWGTVALLVAALLAGLAAGIPLAWGAKRLERAEF
jgi:ABC-2 type transport system permease protein